MAFLPYPRKIGYYTEGTAVDSGDRWVMGNHVRFYEGFPQKYGGWEKSVPTSFLGKCRGMWQWVTLTGEKMIAIGTNLKLYLYSGGMYYDITPFRAGTTLGDPALTDPFTTTMGDTIVEVEHVGHNVEVGDFIHFDNATTVGGIDPNGEWRVLEVIDSDHYTFDSGQVASSSATGGGTVDWDYEIHIGPENTEPALGWGSGTWGDDTWGTPRASSTFTESARTWTLRNWGEDLICNPRGGGIYIWDASSGTSTRATVIAAAPETALGIEISTEDRYLIAYGAHDGADPDFMLVRWCSQNDYNDWTPTTTNTAGDFRLSDGNQIMCAISARGQIVISTDTTIYAMVPDQQFVFGFDAKGGNGVISPNGMTQIDGLVFMIVTNNFYVYDGTIKVLPCDVRNYVFRNINRGQAFKIYVQMNTEFNEFTILYPSSDSMENNRYVAYDYVQPDPITGEVGHWHFGELNRTAMLDHGAATQKPVMTGSDEDDGGDQEEQYLYTHETGVDADGEPMDTLLLSGALRTDDRNRFVFIKKFVPNFKTLVGTTQLTLTAQKWQQSSVVITKGPYDIVSSTTFIGTKLRGGQFTVQYSNSQIGSNFWIGTPDIQIIDSGAF